MQCKDCFLYQGFLIFEKKSFIIEIMKISLSFIFFLIISGLLFPENKNMVKVNFEVLLFTKTEGFKHESIEAGTEAIKKIGEENSFSVFHTQDASIFSDSLLSRFDVIIFLNTSGNILNSEQQNAFEKFFKSGKGFVGIHSATDTEYEWEWYGKMLGTYFTDHPEVQEAVVKIVDKDHISTSHLPEEWLRKDEWYNFSPKLSPEIKIVAVVDESTYEGGKYGKDHPFCWTHEFERGRAWYTAGGHLDEHYSDPLFVKHLLGGILFAAGVKSSN